MLLCLLFAFRNELQDLLGNIITVSFNELVAVLIEEAVIAPSVVLQRSRWRLICS